MSDNGEALERIETKVAEHKDLVTYRLDRLDQSVEKLTATVEKFVKVATESMATAKESVNRVGFFYKYLLPILFVAVMGGGYLSATNKADTVCAAVNQNRTAIVQMLSDFKTVGRQAQRETFERQIASFSQPAC